jgi:hypothetical protein
MPRNPQLAAPSTRTRRRSAPSPRRRRAGVTATSALAHWACGGESTPTPTSSPLSVAAPTARSMSPVQTTSGRRATNIVATPVGIRSIRAPARVNTGRCRPRPLRAGDQAAWRPGEQSAWPWAVPVHRPCTPVRRIDASANLSNMRRRQGRRPAARLAARQLARRPRRAGVVKSMPWSSSSSPGRFNHVRRVRARGRACPHRAPGSATAAPGNSLPGASPHAAACRAARRGPRRLRPARVLWFRLTMPIGHRRLVATRPRTRSLATATTGPSPFADPTADPPV